MPQQPPAAPRDTGAPAAPGEPSAYQETRMERVIGRGFARVTARALAPYQTAVIRIGFAGTWLLFLLREWPHRQELYGPAGPFDFTMVRQLLTGNHGFSVLLWSGSGGWFQLVYVLAIAAAALLMLGWRTRTMSVLFMVGVISLQNRSVFLGDGGDNVLHLMSMYLVLTRCGQVWSLDARRARRAAAAGIPQSGPDSPRDLPGIVLWAVLGLALAAAQLAGAPGLTWFGHGPFPHFGWSLALWGLWAAHGLWWAVRRFAPGEPRTVLDTLAVLAHNAGLLVIMVEVCLVYATAGWYKIQGTRWQDGTAVYYPLRLDYFSPWPDLSHLLGGNGLIVMLITYGTVIVQVAFPFTVFNRRLKNVLLAAMVCEHLSIAFLLGLPFFSLAMITADLVFLPTGFLTWCERRGSALRRRLFPPRAAAPDRAPAGPAPEAAARSAGEGPTLVG
ncbi:HTTM domain-containing protein [Streptomyces sp. NRRL F-4489]|uniref:HTTM domain-containing protein n=1 Tax=Streptomyces sp. NRRL F-4489 TaxID=1609095 RepID=UPI003B63D67C